MKVCVYSIVRGRTKLTTQSFQSLTDKAGLTFDWMIHDNSKDNVGLQVASNKLLTKMRHAGYDYIVRFDNDIIVESDNILAKMVECSELMGGRVMLSPRVKGLRHQPERFARAKFDDYEVGFVEIIGGTLRMIPLKLLDGFSWDVRLPMGIGETAHLCQWLVKVRPAVPLAYIENLTVTHGGSTDKQEKDDPAYFNEHVCLQSYPYVPPPTTLA